MRVETSLSPLVIEQINEIPEEVECEDTPPEDLSTSPKRDQNQPPDRYPFQISIHRRSKRVEKNPDISARLEFLNKYLEVAAESIERTNGLVYKAVASSSEHPLTGDNGVLISAIDVYNPGILDEQISASIWKFRDMQYFAGMLVVKNKRPITKKPVISAPRCIIAPPRAEVVVKSKGWDFTRLGRVFSRLLFGRSEVEVQRKPLSEPARTFFASNLIAPAF